MAGVSPNKGFSWLTRSGFWSPGLCHLNGIFSALLAANGSPADWLQLQSQERGLTLTPSRGQGIFFSHKEVVCALQLCFRRCVWAWGGGEGALGQGLSTQKHVAVPPGEAVCAWRQFAYKWVWGIWRMDWSSFQDRMRTIIRVTETSSHRDKKMRATYSRWEGQSRHGVWESGADSKRRTDNRLTDWEREGWGGCIYEYRHDVEWGWEKESWLRLTEFLPWARHRANHCASLSHGTLTALSAHRPHHLRLAL